MNPPGFRFRLVHTLAFATLLAVTAAPFPSRATTYTWTGGGNSNDWGIGADWQNGQAPVSSLTATDIVYGSSAYAYPNLDSGYSIHSLTFNAATNGYDFNRGSLTLGAGGLTQNSSYTETFDIAVALGADQTWNLASGAGALSFNQGLATAGYALTISAAGSNIIGGAISGSGSLTSTGTGTLTLTGNNTYSGNTTVSSGTLAITAGTVGVANSTAAFTVGGTSTGSPATVALSGMASLSTGEADIGHGNSQTGTFTQSGGTFTTNGANLEVGSNGTGTYTLSGAGSLSTGEADIGVYNGTGIFTQSGGTFTTNGNSLEVGAGGIAGVDGSGTYTLSGTGSLSTGEADIGLFAMGSFIQTGGTFTTNGNLLVVGFGATGSPVLGSYSLSGGSLSTGSVCIGESINATGTFTQSGGTFTTNGANLEVGLGDGFETPALGSYSLSGGSLSTGEADIGNGGPGTFTQSGGTFTTNGNALVVGLLVQGDESGDETIGTGTYQFDGGKLTVGSVGSQGGRGTFNFNGGTLQAGASSTSFFQGLTTANVQAGGALIDTNGFNVTVAQDLLHDTTSGAPATDGGLTKLGAGTLTLTGNNTFTGGAIFAAGTLNVGSAGALGSSGPLSFTGGTLQYGTANTTDYSGRFSGANNQAYIIDTNGQNVTFASALTSNGGSLTKLGGGTLTLTGNNTYSGSTVVNSGTLAITAGSVGVAGSTAIFFVSSTSTSSPAAATLSGAASLSTGEAVIGSFGKGTFTQSGGTFTTNGADLEVGRVATGIYTLSGGTLNVGAVDGGGSRITGGTSTFNFNGGTLQAGAGSTSFFQGFTTANVQAGGATIDTQNYSVTVAQDLLHDTTSGAPATDGGLAKLGAGTLTLSGANTFTGPLNINAGTLAVASESNLGAETDTLTVGGGGELLFMGSATLSRTYDLGISKLGAGSGSTLTFSGATVNGGFLAGPGTDALGVGTALNAVTTLAASTLTQSGGAAALNTSTIRGTLTQSAGATLNLSDSTVTSAGKLDVSGTVNTSGVEIDGMTTINAGGTVANSGGSLILGPGSRTTINAGATAAGNGMLSASSDTTIELNDGLLTNNGTQIGTLNVNYGSTLKGSGTFGTVNVTSGGKFSPGNSPGTATVGSMNLQSGGSYQFELNSATAANNAPGDDADLIHVDNTLTISAGTTANSRFTVAVVSLDGNDSPAALRDFDSSKSYRFVLVTAAGGVTGFNASEFVVNTSGFANNLDGGSFSVTQDGNNLDLVFMPVPEPRTWMLLLMGVGSFLFIAQRRKRRLTA